MVFSGIFGKKCSCDKYSDLLEGGHLEKRFRETRAILKHLVLIAEHGDGEHLLYKCQHCEKWWQRSLSWVDGNEPYVFKVPEIELKEWKSKPFVPPDELFVRSGVVRQYLERGTFEEQSVKCKHAECPHHAIKLSVFCIVHQMENIGIKATFPDNVTWFSPYEKGFVEFSYEKLSALPNYKKYQ